MNLGNVTYARLIEGWTADILRQYERITGHPLGLPVPILDMAERLYALRCDIEDLRGRLASASGVLIADKRWIILNRRQSPSRLNFTLAHELAHWLIDHQDVEHEHHGLEHITGLRCDNKILREKRANLVASVLLMPRHIILREVSKYHRVGEIELSEMASAFGVSKRAMRIRLEHLRDDVLDSGVSLWLSEQECQEMPSVGHRSNVNHAPRPKAAMVKVSYKVLDHALYRKLLNYRRSCGRLYLVLDDLDDLSVDELLALDCVDGFLCITDKCFTDLERQGLTDPSQQTVFQTVADGNWLEKLRLDEAQQTIGAAAHVVAFRGDEQVQAETYTLVDIGRYIEPPHKLRHRNDARIFVRNAQKDGKRVVVVTGCFDLLTSGHVQFLRQAKATGDILVVGIEDDIRVRAFKGPHRPVNTVSQRVEVIGALECVDFTFVISGSPRIPLKQFYIKLHKIVRADVLAVTEDDPYLQDRREEIEAAGGYLAVIDRFRGNSTTSLIRQFLSEVEYSDMLLVSKRQLAAYVAERQNNWRQLSLPLD